jgi:hypothetical protein
MSHDRVLSTHNNSFFLRLPTEAEIEAEKDNLSPITPEEALLAAAFGSDAEAAVHGLNDGLHAREGHLNCKRSS